MMTIAIMGGLTVGTIPTISFRETVQLIEAEAVGSGRIDAPSTCALTLRGYS
jgi:hypothetical protein